MPTTFRLYSLTLILLVVFALTAFPSAAGATHSWNGYHWARTSNPFTINLGNNLSSSWNSYLATTSADWSKSTVLDTVVVAGSTTAKRYRPTSGRVEVCNRAYGYNGWLGVAQIWLSGSHITQGTVKVNDSYFSQAPYNNAAEKQHVMCQEVGHTFGLDHQDESGASLNTCMDYYFNTSASDTKSTSPNQHDYDELVTIYTHLDSTNTAFQTLAHQPAVGEMPPAMNDIDLDGPRQWGKRIKGSPEEGTSVHELDFGGGHKVVTFVIWATEGRSHGRQ